MNIDPKVEPWLRKLLDGVQNSNHRAETTATVAYAAPALVKALIEAESALNPNTAGISTAGLIALRRQRGAARRDARAALALAGERL